MGMLCPNPKQKENSIWDFRCLSRKNKNKYKMKNRNNRKAHVSYNTGKNNEWYTPEYFIEAARKTMGSIDLDPASSDIANKAVKASTYYTKDDNGLIKPWFGNIWLNPPYSRDLIREFGSAVKEKRTEYNQAIILVNNATETRWFHDLVTVVTAICFVNKRIKFFDINGKPGHPLQGQVILYVGSNPSKFMENFSQFGKCRITREPKPESNTVSESYIDNVREQIHSAIKNKGYYPLGNGNYKM
jgi:ParB family chromosome partitioning protein